MAHIGLDEAFICGPAPMMDAVESSLREAGVAHDLPERLRPPVGQDA